MASVFPPQTGHIQSGQRDSRKGVRSDGFIMGFSVPFNMYDLSLITEHTLLSQFDNLKVRLFYYKSINYFQQKGHACY